MSDGNGAARAGSGGGTARFAVDAARPLFGPWSLVGTGVLAEGQSPLVLSPGFSDWGAAIVEYVC